jgi:hypothetical protein
MPFHLGFSEKIVNKTASLNAYACTSPRFCLHVPTHTSSILSLSAALYSTMLSRALFAKQRVRLIEAELLLRDLAAAGRIDEVAPALRRRAEFLRAVGAARATAGGGDIGNSTSGTHASGGDIGGSTRGTHASVGDMRSSGTHASRGSTAQSSASKTVAAAAVEAVAVVQRAAAAARREARGGHSARAPKQTRPL